MSVYIWIRAALDWADEPRAMDGISVPWLREKAELWNQTFSMSYAAFRHRVAEIAAANHARVRGAQVAAWEDIPAGALVMPVDDDDWFVPEAALRLAAVADPHRPALLWSQRTIEVPVNRGHQLFLLRRRLIASTPPTWTCATNNYALIKDQDSQARAGSHTKASAWYDAELAAGHTTVQRLDAVLSVANRHLASQTTLLLCEPQLALALLRRKYRRYRRRYRRALPAELRWCQPEYAAMAALMSELELR